MRVSTNREGRRGASEGGARADRSEGSQEEAGSREATGQEGCRKGGQKGANMSRAAVTGQEAVVARVESLILPVTAREQGQVCIYIYRFGDWCRRTRESKPTELARFIREKARSSCDICVTGSAYHLAQNDNGFDVFFERTTSVIIFLSLCLTELVFALIKTV